MKYIKYFESSNQQKNLEKYWDDIIRVLSKYSNEYNDSISHRISELLWSYSSEASDRMDDIGKIDEECIRMLLNDVSGTWGRSINDILETYYDCLPNIASHSDDVVSDLKDIFADYDINGKYTISKSSDRNDERYIIDINMKDVLLNLDFHEVINRVKSIIGIENINYSGSQDHIKLEFYREITDED